MRTHKSNKSRGFPTRHNPVTLSNSIVGGQFSRWQNRQVLTKRQDGFTLTEVLIIVGIISILVVTLLTSMRQQRLKAEDATMKDDLHRLKIAWEEYYNDNNCYPPIEYYDDTNDCGSSTLNPYLNTLPCSPTGEPYHLEYDATGCSSFKMFTLLQHPDDTQALDLCVYDDTGDANESIYNFGVSSTNESITINCSLPPSPSPTPTPSPTPPPDSINYYCQGIDNCTWFDQELEICSPSYLDDPNCGFNCGTEVGSCNPI